MQKSQVVLYNSHSWDMLYGAFLSNHIEDILLLQLRRTYNESFFFYFLLKTVVFLAVPYLLPKLKFFSNTNYRMNIFYDSNFFHKMNRVLYKDWNIDFLKVFLQLIFRLKFLPDQYYYFDLIKKLFRKNHPQFY